MSTTSKSLLFITMSEGIVNWSSNMIMRLVLLAMISVSYTAQARIWKVDNNMGHEADFPSLQAAIDSPDVVAGDTIYISPSGTSHGNITLAKRLIIIGYGYFINNNYPNIPVATASIINNININAAASGSIISSLTINMITLDSNAINIMIKRNYITSGVYADGTNSSLYVYQNYINLASAQSGEAVGIGQDNSAFLKNNFIAAAYNHCPIRASSGCSLTVANNVLYNGNKWPVYMALGDPPRPLGSYYAYNNITLGIEPLSDSSAAGYVVRNNVNENALTNLFVVAGVSPDGQYQLRDGSPARGAGIGGADCGMFGGAEPYVLSGLPALPVVTGLEAPASASDGSGLPVTVTIKMNP